MSETKEKAINREYYIQENLLIKENQKPDLFDSLIRPKIAVYCRVGVPDDTQFTSFELLKKHYLEYARKKGYTLVAMYIDEGPSKMDGLYFMLKDAEDGKFDLLVTKSAARFCPKPEDITDIVHRLKALPHPVGIFFETDNLYTLDENCNFTDANVVMEPEFFSKGERGQDEL